MTPEEVSYYQGCISKAEKDATFYRQLLALQHTATPMSLPELVMWTVSSAANFKGSQKVADIRTLVQYQMAPPRGRDDRKTQVDHAIRDLIKAQRLIISEGLLLIPKAS